MPSLKVGMRLIVKIDFTEMQILIALIRNKKVRISLETETVGFAVIWCEIIVWK